MTIKASTGLRNFLMTDGSMTDALDDSEIHLYGGAVPASADDGIGSATLLCVITGNGTGDALEFNGAASGGVLTKSTSQAWTGINVASGLATFYRHVDKSDGGAASATERRLQGTIGVAGADMNLTNPSLVASAPQALDYYAIAIPMM